MKGPVARMFVVLFLAMLGFGIIIPALPYYAANGSDGNRCCSSD